MSGDVTFIQYGFKDGSSAAVLYGGRGKCIEGNGKDNSVHMPAAAGTAKAFVTTRPHSCLFAELNNSHRTEV
ncbi:MAG TPA: hypothetical protein PKA77_05900 [Chitinophagaceae bacterium]|jgi:hypothetical protein|nr:hypothetical protein [Chitinophagaceae bacterium]HMU58334.1 hypothetical protein [Chitinophagaceae bacterium]